MAKGLLKWVSGGRAGVVVVRLSSLEGRRWRTGLVGHCFQISEKLCCVWAKGEPLLQLPRGGSGQTDSGAGLLLLEAVIG